MTMNEKVAYKLNWVKDETGMEIIWILPNSNYYGNEHPPDFQNDLNAVFKYIWPVFYDNWSFNRLGALLLSAFLTRNPAHFICEEFIDSTFPKLKECVEELRRNHVELYKYYMIHKKEEFLK